MNHGYIATNKAKITSAVSQLAQSYFKDNLLLSFIGGSYAKGTSKENSDVDFFVVLKEPERQKETEFAFAFKELHMDNELNFTHCGEIFDRKTLDYLIDYTIEFLSILPEIQQVGCYHGDCIFSIFRKGDVVLKFFEEPKIHIFGDYQYLQSLELKAKMFFENYPMQRVQLEKGNLLIENPIVKQYEEDINNLIHSEEFINTPVGIGLERWFYKENICKPIHAISDVHETRENAPSNKRAECPLNYYSSESKEGQLYRHQCLANQLDKE